jgi:DUF971 family protein
MGESIKPLALSLKRDEKLEIKWSDGLSCTYPLTLLRTMCPCAACRTVREGEGQKKKSSLTILPGNFSQRITAEGAHLVGNYAMQIDWSDGHASGIYSFEYLREICPQHRHQRSAMA